MELVKDNVKVEWVELGEGLWGDYDEDNPDDIELLRFDVFVWHPNSIATSESGNWEDPGDASYCTLMPVKTSDEIKKAALQIIMDEVYEPLHNGYSVKKICERLSWISPEWIMKGVQV